MLVVTQTIPGLGDNDLVSRGSVVAAFARVGEPLTVRLDTVQADPGSPVEVTYVPEAEDVPEPPFEVDVFEEARSASEHARLVGSVARPDTEVERWKNELERVFDDGPSVSLASRSPERKAGRGG